jgi:hypothetical protein
MNMKSMSRPKKTATLSIVLSITAPQSFFSKIITFALYREFGKGFVKEPWSGGPVKPLLP